MATGIGFACVVLLDARYVVVDRLEIQRGSGRVAVLCEAGQQPVKQIVALIQPGRSFGRRMKVDRLLTFLPQMSAENRPDFTAGTFAENRGGPEKDPDQ